MCGIALLRDPRLPRSELAHLIEAATARLVHRGPDDRGAVVGADFAAGHTRLAIIDLEGGRQPKQDPSGRWTLTFNGEIYNFRELRAQLESRWTFRDGSDTEVLLAGLVVEGDEFIARLDGMWAFCLHDGESGEVLLSRDRFGKKPLYWFADRDRLACASELPSLRVLMRDCAWSEEPVSTGDYFRYGYALPGDTMIAGVREALPAHAMRVSVDGTSRSWRYWEPSLEPWHGSRGEAHAEIRRILERAVGRRLLASDVEVGAFLSGGVDSSLICALAAPQLGTRLRTFTAGFPHPRYDERSYAQLVAQYLGTEHTSAELDEDEAVTLALRLCVHLGQPFGDASLIPTALVARLASQQVKVVLTGDGGDEVFVGYARYFARRMLGLYRRSPALARRCFERFALSLPAPDAHHSRSLLKRAQLFAAMAQDATDDYVAPAAIRPNVLAMLVPGLPEARAREPMPWQDADDDLRRMVLTDWLNWLPQDILAKVDRATMLFSLEARSPFLDTELVELVLRLPFHWHFGALRGKRLLRASFGNRIPGTVWRRRKQGFASPVSRWMKGALGDALLDLADSGNAGPIDATAVRALLGQHRVGKDDHAQPLWLAFAYLSWRQGALRG